MYKTLSKRDAALIQGGVAHASSEISWPRVFRCLSGAIDPGADNGIIVRVRSYDVLSGEIVDSDEARIYRRIREDGTIEDRITLSLGVWRNRLLREGDVAVFVPVRPMAAITPLAHSLGLGVGHPDLLMILIQQEHPLHATFPTTPSGKRTPGILRMPTAD